ncbi:nucleotidyltransferase domain-containing protein, partial [Tepidanaerobacter acetatoxydans]|uniref:nucleotidyltransferase domain-containing protein n=1 Tax=Tepidanaerobacter acetatoxydans TaxID=499229 RepID=UPI001BD3AD45
MNKDTIVEKLKAYTSSKEKIVFAFLFGSLARDKAGNNSDIDLGIYLSTNCEQHYFTLKLEYKTELEQILKKPVDIVIMN